MEEFIKKTLANLLDTLRYHRDETTGVIEDIPISKFVSIKEKVLYLAKLFSFLDGNFENSLIKKMYIDIISLIHLFDKIGSEELIEKYFHIYKEENPSSTASLQSFKEHTAKYMKENKLRTVAILNTKLYYFDMLIWEHALFSKKIVKYLFSTGYKDISSTHDYLTIYSLRNIKADQSVMEIDFTCEEDNLYIEYEKDEIEYLKLLKVKTEKFEFDETTEKLIASKKGISFFKSMDDEDIRAIVKNVKFMQFKQHETIIREGDEDEIIYFMINGECRVTVGKTNVGLIKPGQLFGEFAAITKERRTATIRTNKPTTVLAFQLALEAFDETPYSFSFLYKNVTNELIKKVDQANKKKY